MGRAIDMENDIHKLKIDVRKIQKVLNELIQGVMADGKKKSKKTNNESSSGSSGESDKGNTSTSPKD